APLLLSSYHHRTELAGWMIMKRLAPLLLLLASIQSSVQSYKEQRQLLLASVLFRHGDRSPVDAYPTDTRYQESYWPQGFGQLSTTGMRQHLYLGSLFRERYVGGGLITENYTRVQVYVRSTDYDRTLMSVEAQLAGLFPPQGDQIFNESLSWQPIPVHTVPQGQDNLLRAYIANCPRYQGHREAAKNSLEYRSLEKENEDFFKRLEESTGIVPTTLDDMWTIQDTLLVQHDTTVAAMTTALDVYNNILPPYAAALMIELYNDTNGDYWVSLYYRNDSDGSNLWPLNINSCQNTTLCSLQEFIDHTAPVIPSDWEMECGLTGDSGENSTSETEVVVGALLAAAVVVIVILSACLLLIALLVKRRKSNAKSTTAFVKMVEDSSEDEKL
ncbi:Lysosomal acid phosphatase, partial [Geodia barretti]